MTRSGGAIFGGTRECSDQIGNRKLFVMSVSTRFCIVVLMKGYSQVASKFGRPDCVEWIMQLIAPEIRYTNVNTKIHFYLSKILSSQ